MDEKGLGSRLQSVRRDAGLTQQELCQAAGLSYSTLAKIERGAIKAPSIFTIQSIAAALGTTLDSLMGVGPIMTLSPTLPSKKTAQNGVRFVYFDVNGCLVRFFQGAFTRLAHESGVPVDEVESAFWHYNDDVCRGDMTMDEFNAAFAKRLHLPSLDWQRYYLDAVDPIKEMHGLVAWAAEHYHVGLLTNIMPGLVDAMRGSGLLPDVPYDVIVDSSQAGAIKPEQRIYEIATERAGVSPQEILLVDDDRSNLRAAEHFGWRVMWFDDYQPEAFADRIRETLTPR
jgi:putative hydrolase of the HAD superfamily